MSVFVCQCTVCTWQSGMVWNFLLCLSRWFPDFKHILCNTSLVKVAVVIVWSVGAMCVCVWMRLIWISSWWSLFRKSFIYLPCIQAMCVWFDVLVIRIKYVQYQMFSVVMNTENGSIAITIIIIALGFESTWPINIFIHPYKRNRFRHRWIVLFFILIYFSFLFFFLLSTILPRSLIYN